ncbi:hypothetical protein [Chengkuizengella sediminis]|uniref:hypothetical protein n=1 Tax=Chengkuizengella sediminis TaxID=1885917 RepID=UPI0013897B11|nr:hypothetical protein [Chengkuizengella sediminis]NDI33421.1 hypothetical protein [Chengkuizengella sediminis]
MSKDLVTMYRGIRIPQEEGDEIREHILRKGLLGGEGLVFNDVSYHLRDRLEDLFHKVALSTKDTRVCKNSYPIVYACGDEIGALCYACEPIVNKKENNQTPFILQFKTELSSIEVDGNDFLNKVFQRIHKGIEVHILKKIIDILVPLYGINIQKYINRAAESPFRELSFRNAISDLANKDPQIVKDHLNNELMIGGMFKLLFRSAFKVKLPILPQQIVSIRIAEQPKNEIIPDIRYSEFMSSLLKYCN